MNMLGLLHVRVARVHYSFDTDSEIRSTTSNSHVKPPFSGKSTVKIGDQMSSFCLWTALGSQYF